jgi:anti-sigma-K factor RskA
MDLSEFVESGKLETYLMGVASPEEQEEVEKMSVEYPHIKAELASIESTLNDYAFEHSVEPTPATKEKIWQEINRKVKERRDNRNWKNKNREYIKMRNDYRWAMAASLLILISLSSNIYLYQLYTSEKTVLSKQYQRQLGQDSLNLALVSQINAVMDSLTHVRASYMEARDNLQVLNDPMYHTIELKGMKPMPEGCAMVCWCPQSKELWFQSKKLTNPPAGMQYVLWAINKGKPINAGMITMGKGLHKMNKVDDAQVFAVTLEKDGDNNAPHGEMYLMGKI